MSDNAFIHKEAFWLLCNGHIGQGVSRVVYDSKIIKDCVIKTEDDRGKFQNIIEWETWNRVQGTEFEKWFAPCEWISASGSVLIMKKTTPPAKYPDKMPVFLTDFKRTNYGMYNGQLVCHDYGTSLLFEYGMSKRMKKAEWWDL